MDRNKKIFITYSKKCIRVRRPNLRIYFLKQIFKGTIQIVIYSHDAVC